MYSLAMATYRCHFTCDSYGLNFFVRNNKKCMPFNILLPYWFGLFREQVKIFCFCRQEFKDVEKLNDNGRETKQREKHKKNKTVNQKNKNERQRKTERRINIILFLIVISLFPHFQNEQRKKMQRKKNVKLTSKSHFVSNQWIKTRVIFHVKATKCSN